MIPDPRPSHTGHVSSELPLQDTVDEEACAGREPVDAVFAEDFFTRVDALGGGDGSAMVGVVEGGGFGRVAGGVGVREVFDVDF